MAEPAEASGRVRRIIALMRPVDSHGIAVFRVTLGKKTTFYTLREIPCDIGGRGFGVHRLGLGNFYHVRIGTPQESSCECLGFLRHGRCKHILGLLALVRAGLL